MSSGVDAAESQPPSSPDRLTPRRSKRTQPPVSSVAKDPAESVSTDPPKRAVRSKQELKVLSNLTARSSLRPQGISNKQPAKITRGMAREKGRIRYPAEPLYLMCALEGARKARASGSSGLILVHITGRIRYSSCSEVLISGGDGEH